VRKNLISVPVFDWDQPPKTWFIDRHSSEVRPLYEISSTEADALVQEGKAWSYKGKAIQLRRFSRTYPKHAATITSSDMEAFAGVQSISARQVERLAGWGIASMERS
jgi:hypothetical protein